MEFEEIQDGIVLTNWVIGISLCCYFLTKKEFFLVIVIAEYALASIITYYQNPFSQSLIKKIIIAITHFFSIPLLILLQKRNEYLDEEDNFKIT